MNIIRDYKDFLVAMGIVVVALGLFYAIIWIFMSIWNYLVDYFSLGIPYLNIFTAFIILIFLSFLKSSSK